MTSECQKINKMVFSEDDLQLIKLWQWNNASIWEDRDAGVFVVNFYSTDDGTLGKYSSIVAPDGTTLSTDVFELYDDFQNGMAKIYHPGKGFGYINSAGDVVFPPAYENAEDFSGTHAFAVKNGKKYLLDKNGNEFLLPEKYEQIGSMCNGRCPASTVWFRGEQFVYHSDYRFLAGMWGYIDESGNEVIKPQYIYANDFDDGLAVVCRGKWEKNGHGKYWSREELWGVIDVDGNEVIPCQYDEVWIFDGTPGIFKVHSGGWKDGKWGVMGKDGKWLVPPVLNNISDGPVKDGLFIFYEDRYVPGDELHDVLYGVYDLANQKVLFEPQFTDVSFWDNGLFCVETVDTSGNETARIIDRSGREIFPSDYSSIYCFDELYVVNKRCQNEVLYGVINSDGSVVLPCKYRISWGGIALEDKTVIFVKNGLYGVMDFEENILIPPEYQKLYHLSKNLFCFKNNELRGVVSVSGKIVIPAECTRIVKCSNDRIIAERQNRSEVFEVIYRK